MAKWSKDITDDRDLIEDLTFDKTPMYGPWKWGHSERFNVDHKGKPYELYIEVHCQEGIQLAVLYEVQD